MVIVTLYFVNPHGGSSSQSTLHLKGYRNPSFKSQNSSVCLSYSSKSRCPTCSERLTEGNTISHLVSFLMSLQETQRQILQLIVDQANHVPLPSNDDHHTRRVMPVNSKDPVTTKHSSGIQESVTFLTHSKVEAIFRKETGSSS